MGHPNLTPNVEWNTPGIRYNKDSELNCNDKTVPKRTVPNVTLTLAKGDCPHCAILKSFLLLRS